MKNNVKRIKCIISIIIPTLMLVINRHLDLTLKERRVHLLAFFVTVIIAFIISGTIKEMINNCKKTVNFWTENCLNPFIGYLLSIFSIWVYLVFCLLIYWFPILLTFLDTYKEETEPKSI